MDYRNASRAAGKFVREEKNGWEYYHVPELTARGIIHGFFTRNCPSFVIDGENQSFLNAFSLDRVITLNQEHGDTVHAVGLDDSPDKGDGILLYKPGIAGVIKTADCLSIVLIDPAFPMVAILHAGWRGTLSRITSKAIDMMTERGAAKQRIAALMGPSIRGCCYTVGTDVKEAFLNEGFPETIFHDKNGSIYLDLKDANARLLIDANIETIFDTELCTFCSDDASFASYRKGARNERQTNFVAISDR